MTVVLRAPGAPDISEEELEATVTGLFELARPRLQALFYRAAKMTKRGVVPVFVIAAAEVVGKDAEPEVHAALAKLPPGSPFADLQSFDYALFYLAHVSKMQPPEVYATLEAELRKPVIARAVRLLVLHRNGVKLGAVAVDGRFLPS